MSLWRISFNFNVVTPLTIRVSEVYKNKKRNKSSGNMKSSPAQVWQTGVGFNLLDCRWIKCFTLLKRIWSERNPDQQVSPHCSTWAVVLRADVSLSLLMRSSLLLSLVAVSGLQQLLRKHLTVYLLTAVSEKHKVLSESVQCWCVINIMYVQLSQWRSNRSVQIWILIQAAPLPPRTSRCA